MNPEAASVNSAFRIRVIRRLHDVIKISFTPAYLQDIDLGFVGTGDGLELLDPVEFALKRTVVLKAASINNFIAIAFPAVSPVS